MFGAFRFHVRYWHPFLCFQTVNQFLVLEIMLASVEDHALCGILGFCPVTFFTFYIQFFLVLLLFLILVDFLPAIR